MRVISFLFILLILTVSCQKEEPDYDNSKTSYFSNISNGYYNDTSITCVTFNIHLGFRGDKDPWDKNARGADQQQVKDISRLLMKVDPDIVALQEVPLNRYNTEIKDFLEALAREMKMNYAFASHGYNDPYEIYPVYGEWGTAILSKYRIVSITNHEVEYVSKWEKRSLLDACLQISPSTKIHAVSLHWLPSEQGIPNTTGYLKEINRPFIVMGDFNYTGEIADFCQIGLKDVDSVYAMNWIDRIFYSSERFSCKEWNGIADTAWWISDHPANYCVLKPHE